MLFLFLRYLNFCSEFPHRMNENGLNKAKVNLKAFSPATSTNV